MFVRMMMMFVRVFVMVMMFVRMSHMQIRSQRHIKLGSIDPATIYARQT